MKHKNLFKSLTAYLCIITIIAFTSCSKDDVTPIADNVEFTNVSLSSVQEVPLIRANSSGALNATYDKTSNRLSYTITYSGITPNGMHIHKGDVGVAGDVELTIAGPYTSGMTGTQTLSDAQETDLLAGNLYLNVHTAANAGGEIRGQVVTSNFVVLSNIALSGKEQAPMNTSTSTGTFNGLYDKTTKTIKYSIVTNGFTPTDMHIHTGAVGVSGLNIITVTGLTGTTTPALSLPEETDLLAGNLYLNIHSDNNGAGEVRGQLVTDNKVIFSDEINAANTVDPISTSEATGSFYGSYDKSTRKLTYLISYSAGLTPTYMHFHKAAAGSNGDVVFGIDSPFSNGMTGTTVALTSAQETDLLSGLWYLNIHSEAFSLGEIRTQLVK